MNTWESYKKFKQRRNTKDSGDNNQAFAMLVSNAINVATNPVQQTEEEACETLEIKETMILGDEEKQRTNRWDKKCHLRNMLYAIHTP